MNIIDNIYGSIVNDNYTISDILKVQHDYHEYRRWSIDDVFDGRKPTLATDKDRAALWHSARAEITTQPACLRMAKLGKELVEKYHDNKIVKTIAESGVQWAARYWLEEEGYHEVAFGRLLEMVGEPPVTEEEVFNHRGDFPDDNFARICVIQACVETEASIGYGEHAKNTSDPLVRDVFLNVTRDEVQHRRYFISFAKALIDSGAYPKKDILSMAYAWIKPEGGETQGSMREKQTERDGFVNWWENIKTEKEDHLSLQEEQIRSDYLKTKKENSVFDIVYKSTGITVKSVDELRKAYFRELLTAS